MEAAFVLDVSEKFHIYFHTGSHVYVRTSPWEGSGAPIQGPMGRMGVLGPSHLSPPPGWPLPGPACPPVGLPAGLPVPACGPPAWLAAPARRPWVSLGGFGRDHGWISSPQPFGS